MSKHDVSETPRHHRHGPPGKERFQNDNTLGGRLHRCAHLLSRQEGGNYATQRRVLEMLETQGEMSQQELQKQLNIQSGSISELITKLEGKGYVRRKKAEQDRRKVMLEITDEGRERISDQPQVKSQEEIFSVLTAEEQAQLQALLQKLEDGWAPRK